MSLVDIYPSAIPHDNFAIRAYTHKHLEAGKNYKLWVRGDDGFQFFAKKWHTNYNVDLLTDRRELPTEWTQNDGAAKPYEFTVDDTGWYDFHFHLYEGYGSSDFDFKLEEVTKPDIDIQLDFYGNFTSTQRSLIQKAADNWERIITQDMDSSGKLHIAIGEGFTRYDGSAWGNEWAVAAFPVNYANGNTNVSSPNTRYNFDVTYDNNRGLDYHTQIHFKRSKLPHLSNNQLVRLAMHEIGHALYLDEAQHDSLLGMDSVMDLIGLDPKITEGMYRRLESIGYKVDRNALIYWS